ncbi:hypothetical protein RR46_06728 [Papilio xuthus]|uniref:Uncharacterized protein n=1 Tax=Papilio xuthus TaxID=66420 RepID=A0A194PLS4_PAPXU|nr:hypothetical protein RR46_06728 [Papilio xuthus]
MPVPVLPSRHHIYLGSHAGDVISAGRIIHHSLRHLRRDLDKYKTNAHIRFYTLKVS